MTNSNISHQELNIKIENVKSIASFNGSIPLNKGVHLLTGKNGSGKSTLLAIMSRLIYQRGFAYLKQGVDERSKIVFTLQKNGEEEQEEIFKGTEEGKFGIQEDKKYTALFNLSGTFEASYIYGQRFDKLTKKELGNLKNNLKNSEKITAKDFIRESLGIILQEALFKNDPSGIGNIPKELDNKKLFKSLQETYKSKNQENFVEKTCEFICVQEQEGCESFKDSITAFGNLKFKSK